MTLSPTVTLYIFTALVSIVIGVILVMWARSTNPVKGTPEALRTFARSPDAPASGEGLDEETSRAIYEAVARTAEHPDEISRDVAGVVGKEIERKVSLVSRTLTQKYEKIIEQKTQNEDIAWQRYEKVLSQKKDTDAVIRSIAEGLVVVDARGKVIMMNPAAEKLLGTDKKEAMGKSILEERPRDDQLISFVKSAPDSDNREIELKSAQDETRKILRASSAVIENENGHPVGMVSVLSDITKQKELDRLKANFVSSVSHELRTPLIAIDKSIALILSKSPGELSAQQEQFLTIAARNLKRLSRLINDILDLSKLEAGHMQLRRQPCGIADAIGESLDGLRNWCAAKSIVVSQEIQEGLPQVNMDSDRIVQVLTNLIGNAVKFTPAGGSIKVAARRAGDREITVLVQDSGIGIPAEHKDRVFDKFYQVGERVSSDIQGTGIGLSISKEIVTLHGGRIWVESEHGQGATFLFTLPI